MSLLEVILASFLLLAVLLSVAQLIATGLHGSQKAAACSQATALAENVLAEIRAWAQDPVNFSSDWSAYDGRIFTDPDYPGLQAMVAVEESGRRLLSPCSTLEALHPSDAVELHRSVVAVRVTVRWSQLHPDHEVRLVTYLDEPDRSPVQIEVTRAGPGDPVPPDGEVALTARLIDAGGDSVPDVTFAWSALPITGNGSFVDNTTPRDGTRRTYKHLFVPLIGPATHVAGLVNLEVRCRYRGLPVSRTVPLVLQ